jgi:hypothetical protein
MIVDVMEGSAPGRHPNKMHATALRLNPVVAAYMPVGISLSYTYFTNLGDL